MQVTYTGNGDLVINDLGEAYTPKQTRKGVKLPENTLVTLADDELTYNSRFSGELSKQILAGTVTVNSEIKAVTQRNTYAALATAAQTVVTLPVGETYIMGNNSVDFFVNGLRIRDYTETNNTTLTLAVGLSLNDKIDVIYYK